MLSPSVVLGSGTRYFWSLAPLHAVVAVELCLHRCRLLRQVRFRSLRGSVVFGRGVAGTVCLYLIIDPSVTELTVTQIT